jgi:predicted outer membrane lipoprotein
MADFLRAVCVGLALPLAFTCVYSMWREHMKLDQRARFLGLAVIGFVVVAGQIDSWGNAGNWRMPLLAVGLLLALGGTLAHLRRRSED